MASMTRVLVKNAADAEQVNEATEKTKSRAERDRNDLVTVMQTPAGRRYVRRLVVETAGLYRSSYLNGPTGRGSDPVFMEGMRNVGLEKYAEIMDVCPELWALAEQEHREQLKREGLTK